MQQFRALVVRERENGRFSRAIEERQVADLPAGDILIRVHYSSLNYKDALSATGVPGVTRRYPHTPGIDAGGIVVDSSDPRLVPGDAVIATGGDLGANIDGGFGQYVRVPADWVVKLPETLSLQESMIYGTAGFTAAMCLERLERHPYWRGAEFGEVLVTGATGGVGSMAVALLAGRGYRVVAATGKPGQAPFLERLGAVEVVGREAVTDDSGRPLLGGRWAAVVDAVGGAMLATAVKSTKSGGAVMVCGNAASPELPINVFPFILRGVTMYGIDSAHVTPATREKLWRLLATDWRLPQLEVMARECELTALDPEIESILNGSQTGRVVVALG